MIVAIILKLPKPIMSSYLRYKYFKFSTVFNFSAVLCSFNLSIFSLYCLFTGQIIPNKERDKNQVKIYVIIIVIYL